MNINERLYQKTADLLLEAHHSQSRRMRQQATKIMDELNEQRNGLRGPSGNVLTMHDELLFCLVRVLSGLEMGERVPPRKSLNALRHLEAERLKQNPSWKLADLNRRYDWNRTVQHEVTRIGMTEMDLRIADKILHDAAVGQTTDTTRNMAFLTEKMLSYTLAEGHDPCGNMAVAMPPERVRELASLTGAVAAGEPVVQAQAKALQQKLQVDKIFHDHQHRDNPGWFRRMFAYLGQRLGAMLHATHDRRISASYEVPAPNISMEPHYTAFAKEAMNGLDVPKRYQELAGRMASVVQGGDRTLVDRSQRQHDELLAEGNLKPVHVLTVTKGSLAVTLTDDSLGFAAKMAMAQGILESAYKHIPDPLSFLEERRQEQEADGRAEKIPEQDSVSEATQAQAISEAESKPQEAAASEQTQDGTQVEQESVAQASEQETKTAAGAEPGLRGKFKSEAEQTLDPDKTVLFGKYKGQPLEVMIQDGTYMEWMKEESMHSSQAQHLVQAYESHPGQTDRILASYRRAYVHEQQLKSLVNPQEAER